MTSGPISRFRELSWRRRAGVASCVAFMLLHASTTLLRGAPQRLRGVLWPAVAWYGDGLYMASTWGMFARPPHSKKSVVVGFTADGRRFELARSAARERGLVDRVVDARLRKIQAKLEDEANRAAWGERYLAYFCRLLAARGIELERVELELYAASLEAPEDRQILLSVTCAAKSSEEGRKR